MGWTTVTYKTINGLRYASSVSTHDSRTGKRSSRNIDTSKIEQQQAQAQTEHEKSIAEYKTKEQAKVQLEQAKAQEVQRILNLQKEEQLKQQETISKQQETISKQQNQNLLIARQQQEQNVLLSPNKIPIGNNKFNDDFIAKKTDFKDLLRAKKTGEIETEFRETLKDGSIKVTTTKNITYELPEERKTIKDKNKDTLNMWNQPLKEIKEYKKKGVTTTEIKLGNYKTEVPETNERTKELLRDFSLSNKRVTGSNVVLIQSAYNDVQKDVLSLRGTTLEANEQLRLAEEQNKLISSKVTDYKPVQAYELQKVTKDTEIKLQNYTDYKAVKETALTGLTIVGGIAIGGSATIVKLASTNVGKIVGKTLLTTYGLSLTNTFSKGLTGYSLSSPVVVELEGFKPSLKIETPKVQYTSDYGTRTGALLEGAKGIVILGAISKGIKTRIKTRYEAEKLLEVNPSTYKQLKQPILTEQGGKYNIKEVGIAKTFGGKTRIIETELNVNIKGIGTQTTTISKPIGRDITAKTKLTNIQYNELTPKGISTTTRSYNIPNTYQNYKGDVVKTITNQVYDFELKLYSDININTKDITSIGKLTPKGFEKQQVKLTQINKPFSAEDSFLYKAETSYTLKNSFGTTKINQISEVLASPNNAKVVSDIKTKTFSKSDLIGLKRELKIQDLYTDKLQIGTKTYQATDVNKEITFVKETPIYTAKKTTSFFGIGKKGSILGGGTSRPLVVTETKLYRTLQKTMIKPINIGQSALILEPMSAQTLIIAPILDIGQKSLTRTDTLTKAKEKIIVGKTKTLTKTISLTKIFEPKEDVIVIPKEETITKTIVDEKVEEIIEPIIEIPKPINQIINQTNIIKPIKIDFRQKTTPQKSFGTGYDVYTKKGGKLVKLNFSGSLEKGEALDFGAKVVSTSARASFKIVKSSSPMTRIKTSKNKGIFTKVRRNLYESKGFFVEKKNKRIKSLGEKFDITFKSIWG